MRHAESSLKEKNTTVLGGKNMDIFVRPDMQNQAKWW